MELVRVPGGYAAVGFDARAAGWDEFLGATAPAALYASDGTLLAINDAMLELLAWPVMELERRGWLACVYPDPEEERTVRAHLVPLAAGSLPRRHSRNIACGDGTKKLVDVISMPLELPGAMPGEPPRRAVSAIAYDVTARDRPVGAARGFRELVEDAPDILSRVDVRDGHYLFISRAVEPLTGYTPEEIYADPRLVPEHLVEEYREPMARAVREVLLGKPQWLVIEYRCRPPGDRRIALHQALYPIRDPTGRVVVIEGVARDITAVRALERKLQETLSQLRTRNQELASLDRMKSQVLGAVSHELRTPLVSIKGYNELILRGSLGPLTPRQQRAMEIASGSTDRLIELIETLLDFARSEEGRLDVHRSRVDLRAAVREAVDQMRERIAKKGLELSVDLAREALDVDGDAARLAQVVRALLSNAQKFCDAPGAIRVTARRAGAHVELAVEDTGIGIPAAARVKIFDRFYQVDSSSTRKFGGTGLGLALARDIVNLHGGEIDVASEEGKGSTFTVRLPPSHPENARGDERPVLLVGAPPEVWPGLRMRLDAEGLVALLASSGSELLRRARRHRPDAVLLAFGDDLRDTIETLHHDPETVSIPVIAMVEDARRQDLLPYADLVVSPTEEARLAAAIRRLLGRPPAEDPTRPARVLIVEDEPEIVDFTRFVLEREGFAVTVAATTAAALAATRRDDAPVDLVIVDLALPGHDGLDLCRQLKGSPRTAGLPVLMMTGLSDEGIRNGAFEAGADAFLLKPFGVDDFLRQVRLHLRPEATPEAVE